MLLLPLVHFFASFIKFITRHLMSDQERKQKEQENAMRADALLRGNPLVQMPGSTSANVKRRWDDDVVFRNMARDEPAEKKRFINDTIRSDFHKRFLKRYVQ
jgi:protein CWC15